MSSNPHGNNPFGRPAGNKDGRHVKRGPNNNNPKGRPTKEAIGIKKLEQARKETDRVAKAAAQAVKDNQDLQKRLREIEEKRRKFHEEARTVLASIGADATVDTNLDDDDDDHTNDDDDDDDYDIDGENEVHINGNGVKAKLTRPSYMPPKGSCLFNQMEEIEKKFASGGLRTFSAQKGMWCYGCSEKKDPVASNSESPDAWYASKFECFTWMPFDYFGTAVDIKSINCVHDGCNSCSLKKLALAWRPVICIDKVAWVLHHRIQCKDCKKTFSTIDPKFLAQLPTRILERFPFMTGKKGPGIHQSLVFHFISLIGKGIMYGTYANSINELHRIRYSMETISYYDTIAEKKDLADNIEFDFIPKVFSNFDSAGEYGGIKLTAKLLRRFTFNYILSREKYFQASFQMVYDEGNASDHTHKLSKVIQIEKGFDDADPMFMDKLTRHFYHNREWWREHCRMYIPKALDHATRLKRVISIPEKDAYLSTLMTDEVKAYFDSFLAKILRGEFEDQNDVVLFIKNGENSHGLPCYLRLRGTVRTENLHQKMKTSIGPWGVWRTNGTHDVATDMLSFQCEKSNKAMRRL